MSHAPPFGCNEYPPGGARPDEEAFVSTEQQSPKHTIFLQRNSKVGVELSMAIVIEGYRKVKRAKLLEVSLMIEKDAAYSGTTVNVKNVEEEKPWSFMKLKEILRP